MKVLFIDDEPLIRRGLRAVIPWDKYGFTEFLEAEDGEEGLQLIEQENPSLIIVDICMLNKSGIVMAGEARAKNFMGRMIILSGYSDFEYAKSAIEADITAYLLKPVNPDELIKAVEKAINELQRTRILSIFANQPTQLYRKKILSDLITGKLTYTAEIENTYHFNFTSGYYRLICVYKLVDTDSDPTKETIYTQLQKNFLSVPISEQELVLFVTSQAQLNQFTIKYLDSTTAQNSDERLFYVISSIGGQSNDLSQLYRENAMIFNALYYYKSTKNVINAMNLKRELRNAPMSYNLLEVTNKLIDAIILLDVNEVKQLVNSFYLYLTRTKPSQNSIEYMLQNSYLQILQQLCIHYPTLAYELCSEEAFKARVSSHDFLVDSIDFFEKQLKTAIQHMEASITQKPCLRICQYIESNFRDNLKLETIAKLFGYNSAYLGKLFQKETGMNFNTYLDRLRIEHAKKHLEYGASIATACESSGFHNTDYFTKKFKKYVGILPSEYRRANVWERCDGLILYRIIYL